MRILERVKLALRRRPASSKLEHAIMARLELGSAGYDSLVDDLSRRYSRKAVKAKIDEMIYVDRLLNERLPEPHEQALGNTLLELTKEGKLANFDRHREHEPAKPVM